jgi:branched-chain amino acid transport system substrate-binding protein
MPRLLSSLALSLIALGLISCGQSSGPTTGSGELVVRIGASSPLTGPQAHLGKDNENGTRLAIDEANAQGITIGGQKVRFELVSEDDAAAASATSISVLPLTSHSRVAL